ncbi:unnamed protein product [Cuscuta epithymum]|uniref:non-specific serine/threonine protein kinase n=3 Tax=Cuscuta epithymum TaxID=186058 RepID=A0AAV0EA73_9ASTE|nr:unnamed protein product [Cuscuta epithymum]CAH9118815.1 unnamed protein product [Cuscuta epithymum]
MWGYRDGIGMRREAKAAGYWWMTFLCFLGCSTSMLAPNGMNYEVQALIGIKAALKDPNGILDKWDGTAVDPCSWNMVTCSDEGLVIGLGIPSLDLSGNLSPTIGNLTNIKFLELRNNNITGAIPVEIGQLSNLNTLDLSNNTFTGQIPALARLTNLNYLRLNNNNLSGKIPTWLTNMTQLSFLDLSNNNLSGPVPTFSAKTFNILGNPLICVTGAESYCHRTRNNSGTARPLRKKKNHKHAIVICSIIGCICSLLLGIGMFLRSRRRKEQETLFYANGDVEEISSSLENLRRFQWKELQFATNNFSSKNILGKGGYGIVYKGNLRDGTVVAVKRLNDGNASGGEKQLQTEIKTISLAVHRNLLRLLGFCMTPTEKLLVYPYMSNGSVASRLRVKPVLEWDRRKQIAIGAARGLLYLHEQCDPKIIHRDVKAANILLDEYYEAVVGDFGLAKLLDREASHVTTAVRGTVGHIAPEYLSTGQSSEKTDVFGFGILLLELITGLKAFEFGKVTNNNDVMLDWVKTVYQEKRLNELVDKELENKYDEMEVGEMVQVALLCTQYAAGRRPKMCEVVRMLEGDGHSEWSEASHKIEPITSNSNSSRSRAQTMSSSERFSGQVVDSHSLALPMELSGPR